MLECLSLVHNPSFHRPIMMKHKKHRPTAHELYEARMQREEEEKDANLPLGLVNHGNTSFMNSTLQGVSVLRR